MSLASSSFALGELPPPATRRHILHADENQLLGVVFAALFRHRNHAVEQVADGDSAWQRWLSHADSINVVVTDHEMPGLKGLEFVARLRSAGYRGRVIVYSSSVTEALGAEYLAFGVAAIITKSASARELIAAVEDT